MPDFLYEDIVNLKYQKDPERKPMSIASRAAQFMPFKSLNEYEDYIADKTDDINFAEDENYEILYDAAENTSGEMDDLYVH